MSLSLFRKILGFIFLLVLVQNHVSKYIFPAGRNIPPALYGDHQHPYNAVAKEEGPTANHGMLPAPHATCSPEEQ